MDWTAYVDQIVVGLIGIVLTYLGALIGQFLRAKTGSEMLATTVQEFLAKRETAWALWHQVEGEVEGKIKTGVLKVASAAEKARIKLNLFVERAVNTIPGVDDDEARRLAEEMTSRAKAGAAKWAGEVLDASSIGPLEPVTSEG